MTDLHNPKPAPGEARAPGPTLYDLLRADATGAPDALLAESYEFLGDDDLPYELYTSPSYAEAENEHMWGRVWQWACREEHIPDAGDYYVYDVGPFSALIVRTDDGTLKAYYNACMHRGTQLKQPGTCGRSKQLKCPFHGWTWDLEGQLVALPEQWDFPHAGADTHGLEVMSIGTWAGFVFVNFDPNAAPLEDYLGVLPGHFADWHIEDRYIETHIQKRLPANWKAAAEAFLEAYHVMETHAGGLPDSNPTTAYDIFGDNVSRFIHTIGSPRVVPGEKPDEQQIVDMMMRAPDGSAPTLPEGMTAREFYARTVQQSIGEQYGGDFSHLSVSETLDSIEYFLFPNAFFFPGLSLGMVYRFRPILGDPDHSIFDLLMLRPKPADGRVPPPPEPIRIDVDDSYTVAESLGNLGVVYDQDTANMAAQTRGFKGSYKRGQTLGNYQEVRARHLQMMVKRYVDAGAGRPAPGK